MLAAGSPALIGVAATAYTLGMRHAFDPDHIAAIDTVTRNLSETAEGRRRASTVGVWFALGHSTVVFLLAVATIAGAEAAAEHAGLAPLFAGVGQAAPWVTTAILTVMGAATLLQLRHDGDQVLPGGVVGRVAPRMLAAVRSPQRMVAVGFVFGLGFDTATEIALLILAATATASVGWAALAMPMLFAAGMTTCDFADSTLLAGAYRWAITADRRRVLTRALTGLSGGLALLVAGWQALGLAGVDIDLGWLGFVSMVAVAFGWAVTAAGLARTTPAA